MKCSCMMHLNTPNLSKVKFYLLINCLLTIKQHLIIAHRKMQILLKKNNIKKKFEFIIDKATKC